MTCLLVVLVALVLLIVGLIVARWWVKNTPDNPFDRGGKS